MLRVQRVCGKSRTGAPVPLCIKLQGAVVCGRPQQQNSWTGRTSPTESLQRSDSQDQQPFSPLIFSVCKSVGSNPEHCEQPHGKEPSSGKVLVVVFLRHCFVIMFSQKGIKKHLISFWKNWSIIHSLLCCCGTSNILQHAWTIYNKNKIQKLGEIMWTLDGKVMEIWRNWQALIRKEGFKEMKPTGIWKTYTELSPSNGKQVILKLVILNFSDKLKNYVFLVGWLRAHSHLVWLPCSVLKHDYPPSPLPCWQALTLPQSNWVQARLSYLIHGVRSEWSNIEPSFFFSS